MKKSWQERLAQDQQSPRVIQIPPRMRKKAGAGTMVVPTLREVDEAIRTIPKGKLATIQLLSDSLARKHGTNIACTVTTGILARFSANAAHEAEADGKKRIAPYWRVLKAGGELNSKYPGGIAKLQARLRSEGHSIAQERSHYRVEGFESRLARL